MKNASRRLSFCFNLGIGLLMGLPLYGQVPTIDVNPTNLTFNYFQGDPVPAPQTLSVTSPAAAIPFTASIAPGANWLGVSPASAVTPAALSVSVNPAGLAPGRYVGSVRVGNSGAPAPHTVGVLLVVNAARPQLRVTPPSLTFDMQPGQTTATQNLQVQTDTGSVGFASSVIVGGNTPRFFDAAPVQSSTPATVAVTVRADGLPPGVYSGVLRFSAPAAGNSPVDVNVTMVVPAVSFSSDPPSVTFTLPRGSAVPPAQNITIRSNAGTLPFSLNPTDDYIIPSLTQGRTPATLGVTVNIAGFPAGRREGALQLTGPPGSTGLNIPVIVIITEPVVVTTTSVPDAQAGEAYSTTLAASGGTPPYLNWQVVSGALPPGLTLNAATGVISGVTNTTNVGPFPFSVTVRDSVGATSAPRALSMGVRPAPLTILTTSPLTTGLVGLAYSFTMQATGGVGTHTWSVENGSLPGGLTLSTAGVISGTPTAAGPFSFTIRVTDVTGLSVNRPFNLTIDPQVRITNTSPMPAGTVGRPYSESLNAVEGRPPYAWALAAGNLPAGLTVSAQGAITGTPTAEGTATFQIRVTDSASGTDTREFSLTIGPAVRITTTSPLTTGGVGTAYSQAMEAAGGRPPYTWSVASGSLPGGLSLSPQGLISGTPTAPGDSTFAIRVTDSASGTDTRDFTLTIVAAVRITTASPLNSGVVGAAYTQTIEATGGRPPYTWAAVNGTLPAGLTLSPQGVISGTPTAPGDATVSIRVTDSASATDTREFALSIAAAVRITTTSPLLTGGVGVAYSQTIQAAGGRPPYTWSLASGSLPLGLTLSPQGAITGTPTTAGDSTFTIRVTDSAAGTDAREFALAITAAVRITTASPLNSGVIGAAYTQNLEATGGRPPYTWAIANGSLPAGLTLSAQGSITGTPTSAGDATVAIRVTDSASASDAREFAITIAAAVRITSTSPLPGGGVGTAYSHTMQATGGRPPYTWALASGSLPAGLTLSPQGVITGTPTSPGDAAFSVRVTDSVSGVDTREFALAITAAVRITTTSPLAPGSVGAQYSQNMEAAGGRPPYTWAIANGSPPAGLALSPQGAITGTPTSEGTTTLSIRVTDSASGTDTREFSVTIVGGFRITTTSPLPAGLTGTVYSLAMQATGGRPPYTWTLASGALPAGLTLSQQGAIAGTPTAEGTATFAIRGNDSASGTETREFSLTIGAPVRITTASPLPQGAPGTAYSQTMQASGGRPPYTWAVASGALPAGLVMSPQGAITGTPTTPGPASFAVRVTDSVSGTDTRPFTLTITGGPPRIEPSSLPSGITGTPYFVTFSVSGGAPPFTFAVASGILPAGLTLTPQGVLSGTPSAPGTASFTLRVTDGQSGTATQPYTVTIVERLTISTTSPLSTGIVGTAYTQPMEARGGTPPYRWALAAGSLPPGLTLSPEGSIAGTPTEAGPSSFSIRVTDSASGTASQTFNLTVSPALTITTPSPVPSGVVGVAYSRTFEALGGRPPFTWSLASGSLPAGLTLSAAGVVTGTPSSAGAANFTVRVTDSASATASKPFSITIGAGLTITTVTLPPAVAGTAYTASLEAAGGTTPFTWSLASGSLPAGLTLSAAGTIAGTPAEAGSASFTVRVADSASATATQALTLTIGPRVSISTPQLNSGSAGAAYSLVVEASGGTPPYRWSVASGNLPAGLTLSSEGVITGTPSAPGTSSFTIQVTDAASASTTRQFTLTISAELRITFTSAPPGVVGTAYTAQLTATGGTAPLTWSLAAGNLPAGLALSPTGEITGTPTAAGSSPFTVRVTDSASATATQALTIVIGGSLSITSLVPNRILEREPDNVTLRVTGSGFQQASVVFWRETPLSTSFVSGDQLQAIIPSAELQSAGTFDVSVRTPGQPLSNTLPFEVAVLRVPSVRVTGVSEIADPTSQPLLAIALDGEFTAPLEGRVTLSFRSDAVDGADGARNVTFINGSRTVDFVVNDPNEQVRNIGLQVGTVAGTITLTTTLLRAGGRDLSPPLVATQTIEIRQAPPVITRACIEGAPAAFDIVVSGFSVLREVTRATFRFAPSAGSNLDTLELAPPGIGQQFTTWFQTDASKDLGGVFKLTQQFSIDGNPQAVEAIEVVLTSRAGDSATSRVRLTDRCSN